jgi:hypothetical protein
VFPASDLSPMFSHTLSYVDAPATSHGLVGEDAIDGEVSPGGYFIRDVGGLSCRWTDGGSTDSAATQYVTLTAMPETAEWYSQYVTSLQPGNLPSDWTGCNGIGNGTLANFCTFGEYAHGSLVFIDVTGMKINPGSLRNSLPTPVKSLIDSALGNLSSVAPAAPRPTGSVLLLSSSVWLLTGAELQSALGTTVNVAAKCESSADGGPTLEEEAQLEVTGSIGCSFAHESGTDNAVYGGIEWMPGGEWAANQAIAATPKESVAAISGLHAGDTAAEVTGAHGEMAMDLVIGGNWFYVSAYAPSQVGGDATDAPKATAAETLAAIAQDLETNIRG